MSGFMKTVPARKIILRPLIPTAGGILAGVALGTAFPGFFAPALIGSFLTAFFIVYRLRRGQCKGVSALLFCVAAGYLSIQPWVAYDLPPRHIRCFCDKGVCRIEGIVEEVLAPSARPEQLRMVLAAHHVRHDGRLLVVCGRLQVTVANCPFRPRPGDRIKLTGRVRTIRNFMNPGGFDYERHMALKKIFCRIYVRGDRIELAARRDRRSRIDVLRAKLSDEMDSVLTNYSKDVVAVLKALLIGDATGIDAELRDAFNRTGVGHLLAISGLHVGLVGGGVFFLGVRLFAWIPYFTRRAWTRRAAGASALVPVFFYALLAGLAPATQRAAIMVSVLVLGNWVGRSNDLLNTLAIAAIVIVMCSPPVALSISFQLSFSAMTAIILGLRCRPAIAPEGTKAWFRKITDKTGRLVRVSVLAILGTLPLSLFYFHQISYVGVLLNLVAVPLAGTIVIPVGLFGSFCATLEIPAAAAAWRLSAAGLECLVGLIRMVSQWPWVAARPLSPSLVEIGIFYLLLFLFLTWKKRKDYSLACCVLVLSLCLDAGYWVHRRYYRRSMEVTVIDVGQGNACLLELPQGYTVLVDGGGFSDLSAFDVGRSILTPLFLRKKIQTIDLVILTHANSDHLNGLIHVLDHFHVKEVWSNHEKAPTRGYDLWKTGIAAHQIRHVPFAQLNRKMERAGVRFEILAPPADYQELARTETWRDLNNNSLVVRVSFGDVSFLFTGDIGRPAERALIEHTRPGALKSTVLFVPHHGSRYSSTPLFLEKVSPSEAIVCAGHQNVFRFPHKKVLERLEAIGSRVWRTDINGAIRIVTNGKSYKVIPRLAADRSIRTDNE